MSRTRRMFCKAAGILLSLSILLSTDITAMANDTSSKTEANTESKAVKNTESSPAAMEELSVGLTVHYNPDNQLLALNEQPEVIPTGLNQSAAKAEKEQGSDLVMANVQDTMNIRSEASEDGEKVGVLYKDCGGRIIERRDGWTKIKSGELVGWAKDEYLLFDEEARQLAEEVGNTIVTIRTDALRIRKEPSTDAEVHGLIAQDDALDVIEVLNDEWISVDYNDETGYVSAEFVNIDFHIDSGETLIAVKAREKAEAEAKAKAKLTANQGAVVTEADDTRLLAALIYCEAGNQGYEGQLAVGATVMNRVRSSAYPNSVSGVIYASGQFPPALNGKVARVYNGNIPQSCLQAASDSINGSTNIGGSTHFKRVGAHDGTVIGDHVFW